MEDREGEEDTMMTHDQEDEEGNNTNGLDPAKVYAMIQACRQGNTTDVHLLLQENPLYACQQDHTTGQSPLMAAADAGHATLCQTLLEAGAPWNAIDRNGQCAGNYATHNQHWAIVNLLVDWGVRAELILGMLERTQRDSNDSSSSVRATTTTDSTTTTPVEQQPSTKPDYLRQRLQYTADGQALLDADQDAVMMEWERPLMKAHAQILMEGTTTIGQGKRVMNVGFGMGIIDTALQECHPLEHLIIEAHPDVYQRMLTDQWDKKPGVRICFGRWQDVLPQLIAQGVQLDAIFFDTYAEHALDMQDFHAQMVHLLAKPNGVYSFFNGLAPDNLFFHGVACQCVKLQLAQLGLDSEFLPCEIQVKNEVWEGIRRKYWHGRDTYYLPRCTWNINFLTTGNTESNALVDDARKRASLEGGEATLKRQKTG
jgi:protein arginine N-methyltransferase 2